MAELLGTSVKKIRLCIFLHIILEGNEGRAVTQIIWNERVN